jgi:hypothetical protein
MGDRVFLCEKITRTENYLDQDRLPTSRESEDPVVNAMIECSCDSIVKATNRLLETISDLS